MCRGQDSQTESSEKTSLPKKNHSGQTATPPAIPLPLTTHILPSAPKNQPYTQRVNPSSQPPNSPHTCPSPSRPLQNNSINTGNQKLNKKILPKSQDPGTFFDAAGQQIGSHIVLQLHQSGLFITNRQL
jgi:hypothetical protein